MKYGKNCRIATTMKKGSKNKTNKINNNDNNNRTETRPLWIRFYKWKYISLAKKGYFKLSYL